MSESKETTWTQHMSVTDVADEIDEFELDFTVRSGPQVITFMLGEEKYGVDILRARELITYPVGAVTPIPGMPAFIVGVLNLRGVVIPVMDLRIRFQLSDAVYNRYTVIIIVEVEGKQVGLIIDSVSDVVHLEEEQVQSVEHLTAGIDSAYISGVVIIIESMVILLDVNHLLSARELEALSETGAHENSA
jgi:purine-binding chemotaxis protein CheW